MAAAGGPSAAVARGPWPAGSGNGSLVTGHASSASFQTLGPAAPLSSFSLVPGYYLVTVQASDANGNTSAMASKNVSLVQADLSSVRVYPNPWRSDKHAVKFITFDNLSINSTVKIFTISGHWVKTLPTSNNSVTWDLTNDSGDKVASGTYVYVIKDDQGQKKTGQVAVIK